jgi:3'-phosphoadenosine 5'-phosphosulfate sulfotransferase (PAPS reductase)/FAD synthetase
LKIEKWQLQFRQNMPLWMKIKYTEKRIINWYEYWGGKVYISFSGGKDSTVLLDICRKLYPDIVAVFCDTGLEFPEIRKFVKTIDNVLWIKPAMNFKEVINKHGYPIISKEVSGDVHKVRSRPNGKTAQRFDPDSDYIKKYGMRYCVEKYKYLIDAPFKISDICCDVLKKNPSHNYEKQTGNKPIIGMMASDSVNRATNYLKNGCNAFSGRESSNPIAFWRTSDIWEYIKTFNIPYSSIYDLGYSRTGCMFCMFGVHLGKGENNFQRMAKTHPKIYNYCINKLNLGMVMDYIGVNYK